MIRTVDLVIAGSGGTVCAAAVEALRARQRVLIVLGSGDGRVAQRLRRRINAAAGVDAAPVTVITAAEVVCVAGVDRVEAVVIRYVRTGRLIGVNASMVLSCGGSDDGVSARA